MLLYCDKHASYIRSTFVSVYIFPTNYCSWLSWKLQKAVPALRNELLPVDGKPANNVLQNHHHFTMKGEKIDGFQTSVILNSQVEKQKLTASDGFGLLYLICVLPDPDKHLWTERSSVHVQRFHSFRCYEINFTPGPKHPAASRRLQPGPPGWTLHAPPQSEPTVTQIDANNTRKCTPHSYTTMYCRW